MQLHSAEIHAEVSGNEIFNIFNYNVFGILAEIICSWKKNSTKLQGPKEIINSRRQNSHINKKISF